MVHLIDASAIQLVQKRKVLTQYGVDSDEQQTYVVRLLALRRSVLKKCDSVVQVFDVL